jgi:4-amino-4-deoxy-L-arabinose transferase-like glycosyltransferase
MATVRDGTAGPREDAAPAAPPAAPGRSRVPRLPGVRELWRSVSVPAKLVILAAGLSALGAVLIRAQLFPYLSINNDEAIYRLQAETIAHGHLFPPAPSPRASFTPWLGAIVHGHYVLKYTPVVPAFYALSLLLTGTMTTALALLAPTGVVLAYLLARELFGDGRVGAVAAWLFAASPLVIVSTGQVLAYLPSTVLLELAALTAVRGARSGRRWTLASCGLAFGLLVTVRPYDALLLFTPLAVWALLASRGRRLASAAVFVAGTLPAAAVLLATDAAATGSPLKMPFGQLTAQDKLGFGRRHMYPTERLHDFGLYQGLDGVWQHLWLLGSWAFGGVLLAVGAVWALARRRVPAPAVALACGALAMVVGYVGFWGAWNATILWGGPKFLGPWYFLPVLLTLVLLGARALVDLAGARPRLSLLAVGAGLALSATVFGLALRSDVLFTHREGELAANLAALPGRPVVLEAVEPEFILHPSALVANPPGMDGRILFGVSRGADDLAVARDHADRPLYALRFTPYYNRRPGDDSVTRLQRMITVSGNSVDLGVTVGAMPAGTRAARLVVNGEGWVVSVPLALGTPARASLRITPSGFDLSGLPGPRRVIRIRDRADRSLKIMVYVTPRTGKERFQDQQIVPVSVAGGRLSVLAGTGPARFAGDGVPPQVTVLAPGG